MVLDGLSNIQGKYIPPSPLETQNEVKAKSKVSAQRYLKEVNDSELIEKVDPDEERQKNNKQHALTLAHAKELLEEDDENQEVEEIEENISETEKDIETNYTMKFNKEKSSIEITDTKNNEIIETISPDELLNVLVKAKNINGIFVDRKI